MIFDLANLFFLYKFCGRSVENEMGTMKFKASWKDFKVRASGKNVTGNNLQDRGANLMIMKVEIEYTQYNL